RLYAAQSDATNLIQKAIENPTVNSLTLALDCLQESLKVEPAIREQLEEMLEAGLESPEPEVAKLAAEVRLSRRLSSLFEIDENLEIDPSYITCAEYQLFVDQQLNSGERFQAGSAKRPITGISWENALGFCAWLSSKAQSDAVGNDESVYYYRLPTATEAQNYPAGEDLPHGCWTIERSNTGEQGIRVFKAQLPPEYIKLTNYLSAGEWSKADQESASVMLQMAGQESQESLNVLSIEQFSPQALHTIELLWCQYSRGRYGWFAFDVITVNVRGREIQRKPSQARYFLEDLGNGITLDMVYIPGGTFMMGSPEGEGYDSEKPQHEVSVSPFFIGKYPVTQAQWKAIASLPKVERDLKPYPSNFKGDDRPVERVSWNDAVEFCQRLSKQTGKEYRLPTEAEWEYACRAGTTTPFHFGETITGELANYRATETYASEPKGEYREQTTPVGSFPPNAFGLYDMHGQVWEWCADPWHDNYNGAPDDGSAWTHGGNNNRSPLRGGSWVNIPDYCRSAFRVNDIRVRDVFYYDVGFRVVCVAGSTLLYQSWWMGIHWECFGRVQTCSCDAGNGIRKSNRVGELGRW
nr:SUMF1/EgtB/PvdO family nonheme iron enzyme [Pleurocapsa sp. MO_226.B13]